MQSIFVPTTVLSHCHAVPAGVDTPLSDIDEIDHSSLRVKAFQNTPAVNAAHTALWSASSAHFRRPLEISMRPILVFAIVMIVAAAVAPRFLRPCGGPTTTAQATAERSEPSYPRTASIRRGANGHFEADAYVDGRRMGFMIDTGASVIALRQQDAARLGIRPAQRDFIAKVTTANGVVFAAPTELASVELGGILVHNVAAIVLPDEALAQNLLGMSFLSRIHWQYQGGRLMLEQ
jgi:aspartyl protease family protein